MGKAMAWVAAIGGAAFVVGLIGRGLGRTVQGEGEGARTFFLGLDETGWFDDVAKGALILAGAMAAGFAVHAVAGGAGPIVKA